MDTIDGGIFTYLIDCFAVDPSPLWEAMAGKGLTIHNAAFDLAFLSRLGFVPGAVHDTLLMAKALAMGGPDFHRCALKDCARRELNLDLDKAHQKDDWSGDLSPEMLAYAAQDAVAHRRLYEALRPKVQQAGLVNVIRIEERALPAFVWLRLAGIAFDRAGWRDPRRPGPRRGRGPGPARLDAGRPGPTRLPRQRRGVVLGQSPAGQARLRGGWLPRRRHR